MLEVSDQETVEQKDYQTAYVSIPVQIGPKIPLLRCPDYAVKLNAGGRPRTVDIPTLCHAWLPDRHDPRRRRLRERAGRPSPGASSCASSGTGERTVELKAGTRAPSSIDGRLGVKARGGPESTVAVSASSGMADGRSPSTPTATRCRASGLPTAAAVLGVGPRGRARRGPSTCGPTSTRRWRAPTAPSPRPGPGRAPACRSPASGCDLTVTAGATARGHTSVDVAVADGPGRNAPGPRHREILGKPDAPTSVSAARPTGSAAASPGVRWLPAGHRRRQPDHRLRRHGEGPRRPRGELLGLAVHHHRPPER